MAGLINLDNLNISGNITAPAIAALQQRSTPAGNFGPNHIANVTKFLSQISSSSTTGYKGMWASYGNAFDASANYFVGVGQAASDGRPYTAESFVYPASQCKSWFQAMVGKALEEGYFSMDEYISKYVKWFTGTAKFYVQIFSTPEQASRFGYTGAIASAVTPSGTDGSGWQCDSPSVVNFADIVSTNPDTYVYCLGNTNLATWPISLLQTFNWPMLYGFLVFGSTGNSIGWTDAVNGLHVPYVNDSSDNAITNVGRQTMGAASALTFRKWRKYYFENGYAKYNRTDSSGNLKLPDFFWEMHNGPDQNMAGITLEKTVQTWVSLCKGTSVVDASGNTSTVIIPLLWNPGQRQVDNYGSGLPVIPQIYGTSDEMSSIVMQHILANDGSGNNLRGVAYPSSGKYSSSNNYFINKILVPLGITNAADYGIFGYNVDTFESNPSNLSTCEFAIRRNVTVVTNATYPNGIGRAVGSVVNQAATNGAGGATSIGAGWGIDPNYVVDGRKGQTVWSSQYPNDNLGKWVYKSFATSTGDDTFTAANAVVNGGSPFSCLKIKHLPKFMIMLANGGWYNGVQVLKPATVNFILNNHTSALSPLYYAPQAVLAEAEALNGSFNGGFLRYSDNTGSKALFSATSSYYGWGGALGTKFGFDIVTGDYFTLGTTMYSGTEYASTLPLSTQTAVTAAGTIVAGGLTNFRRAEGVLKAIQQTKY